MDDKVAGYVFSAAGGFNPPKMELCSSAQDVFSALDGFAATPKATSKGFVIRATHLHSNKGVYVLPEGLGGVEMIRGMNMSLADIKTDLLEENATKVVIEEYVPGPNGHLPTEYKFHMFGGNVGSINIFHGRGSPCGGCWAEIDETGARLDQHG